ncbi:exosortase [Thalassotalea insulae]|uniref:exosortase n=1 Tax=Thalassotalea insulae TaxID=2056778 RepID=UPI0024E10385|nr:exosortase [Thalassotalea insulae]
MLTFASQFQIVQNIWQFSFDDGTYSHAYLIPFISAYLYWQLFTEGRLVFQEKLNLALLLCAIIILYTLVIFTFAQFTTGFRIFLILFYTAIIAVIFKPNLKVLFPALFLIFIIPVWGILTTPLQELSTSAVTFMMKYSGIPIFVEGNTITIPEGIFEIAGGCSGLRYLIVSLAVSSLFIFMYVENIKSATSFLLLAIVGALVTNWIRITALILIGHFSNMESELMTDHNTFGWYLYIPFMILLFAFGQKYCIGNTTTKQVEDKPVPVNNKSLISVFLLLLVGSSLSQALFISDTSTKQPMNCLKNINEHPRPDIISAHSLCVSTDNKVTTYIYQFDGLKIGNTVDYYENQFIPKGYEVTHSEINNDWHLLTVRNSNASYTVKYQFVSGTSATASKAKLKQLKVLNALKGIRDSQLVWKISADK